MHGKNKIALSTWWPIPEKRPMDHGLVKLFAERIENGMLKENNAIISLVHKEVKLSTRFGVFFSPPSVSKYAKH